MMTVADLKTRTVKDLASMAKRKGVPGWHSMRKEQLVRALVKHHKSNAAKSGKRLAEPALAPSKRRTKRQLDSIRAKLAQAKNLAHVATITGNNFEKDRLVAMVRDSYWLHAYWELTPQSVDRAEAAMGRYWHGAKPTLRLVQLDIAGATTSSSRKIVRNIEIHGSVNNWYVDVNDPPKSYQLEIGYLGVDGNFFSLARSNAVTTPCSKTARKADSASSNWHGVADDFDRIYALSGGYKEESEVSELKEVLEEQLQRPMGTPMVTRFGLGACSIGKTENELPLEVDAELVVYGVTDGRAHVTIKGEPVNLQSDGTFTAHFALPDRRQVLPIVASSGDGTEQRTIILAIERNTKVLEPVVCEPDK